MSGRARMSRVAPADPWLRSSEVADLLGIALAQCGRSDESPANLPELMGLAAAQFGRELDETALCQVADAVVRANRLPRVADRYDPLAVVAAAVMSAREDASRALHALLVEAWLRCELEADAHAGSQASAEDLERADLERLTLAGRLFLLAHAADGRLLVSERVCGLGLAGALLAELVLADLVRLTSATGRLVARADVVAPRSVSPVASDLAARLRQPCPVRLALDVAARDAYERVRDVLFHDGILASRESRQLLPFWPAAARTLFPPERPRLPERVFNSVAALPETDASQLDLQDAALVALARSTGLAAAAGRQWWMAEKVPAEEAAARNPGLSCLIGQVGAVVTATVAARQK